MTDTEKRSFLDKLRRKVTYFMMLEVGTVVAIVVVSFAVSTNHFLNESVQSLVPFSALSNCNSYSEVYTLVPQSIYQEFPATLITTNYATGKTDNGVIDVKFFANWSSCLVESVDNNFHLLPEKSIYYQYIDVYISESKNASFYGSSSTNDQCFQLNCGFEYVWNNYVDPRKNYGPFLNNSLFIDVPYNYNDLIEVDDFQNATIGDSQLITAIYGTNNSVTASCAVSMAGYYLQMFNIANSVTSTGTYLCTQYVTPLQAVSSGLSIALATVGICRLYFGAKSYIAKL